MFKKTIIYAVLGCCATFVLFLAGCVMNTYNCAINSEERIQEVESNVNVTLTTRFNKLNELAQCVKQYDEHEYRVLHETIEARGKNMSGQDAKQCLMQIAAAAEQYPQLQSQKNYQILMNETSLIENKVAQVKNSYNNAVRSYKTLCRSFPDNIILNMLGYEKKEFSYYEINPDVSDNKPLEMFK